MKQKKFWVLPLNTLGISIMLSGCTSLNIPSLTHPPFHKKSWQQRRHALTRIRSWNIDGAFSIRQMNKSTIASYTWQQRGNSYNIRIHSSLDIYTADISGRPNYVALQRSNQQRFSARTPERLMQKQLGWHLPISSLHYWMRGLPAPGKYQATFDTFGHLIYLQQAGWQIQFSNYISIGKVDLPRTLQLNSDRFAVKIVIKHWECQPLYPKK